MPTGILKALLQQLALKNESVIARNALCTPCKYDEHVLHEKKSTNEINK